MLKTFTLNTAAMFVLGIGYPLWAAGPCSQEKATRAEDTAGTLRSWKDIREWYSSYSDCNDADAEEGISESIARLLVHHWDTLHQLVALTKSDARFREAVLSGISPTLLLDDVKAIRQKSIQSCPAMARSLCNEIRRRADAAIADDLSIGIR